jgi:hypothetical protein
MFDYEKGLYDVVSIEKKRFIHLRWVYILLFLIQIIILTMWQQYIIYTIPSFTLSFILMYVIETYIKKTYHNISERRKQSYYDIFYPAFLSEIEKTTEQSFKWVSNLNRATSYIENHAMYPTLNVKPLMHLQSDDIHIYITEYDVKKHSKKFRLWLSLSYIDDIHLEIRSFQRVSQNYPFKLAGSGFMMYADQKDMISYYRSLYERIRVIKTMDQVDMIVHDDMCDITWNMISYNTLEDIRIKDKVLRSHIQQLQYVIDTTLQMIKILKEPKDAYRK